MKESFLEYHYSYLRPETEWLFVTPSLDSRDLNIQVQELGHFIYDGESYTLRGPLESYQIVFSCKDTPGRFEISGNTYPNPNKNEIAFIDFTKGANNYSTNGGDAFFVHFWGKNIRYYYDLFFRQNNNSPIVSSPNQTVLLNLRQLLSLYKRPNSLAMDINAEVLIMEMILSLIQQVTPLQESRSPYVEAALRIIDERYAQTLSLDQLAQEVHVSKFYLSHIFKREMGVTPASYLQQFRVNKAKELLRTTYLSQEAICEQVGLYNCSYLSKLFRLYEGLTPDQYRKKWR